MSSLEVSQCHCPFLFNSQLLRSLQYSCVHGVLKQE